MPSATKIQDRLSKSRFFRTKKMDEQGTDLMEQASIIIAKCRAMLSLIHDTDTQQKLNAIISNTQLILRLASDSAVEVQNEHSAHTADILTAFDALQNSTLLLPTHINPDKELNSTNYKIALVCFYLIVLSIALALSTTFGAWYFGFIAAEYFMSILVSTLSLIGIPALCLGIVSYGIHLFQPDSSQEITSLEEKIDIFCESISDKFKLEEGFIMPVAINPSGSSDELSSASASSIP